MCKKPAPRVSEKRRSVKEGDSPLARGRKGRKKVVVVFLGGVVFLGEEEDQKKKKKRAKKKNGHPVSAGAQNRPLNYGKNNRGRRPRK